MTPPNDNDFFNVLIISRFFYKDITDVIYNVTRNAIRNGINGVMFLELCGYE